MNQFDYEMLIDKELEYQDKVGKIVGIPFAVVAMPSFVFAFLGFFAFGFTAILIAVPGIVALIVSMSAFWILTQNSEKREWEFRKKLDEVKRSM